MANKIEDLIDEKAFKQFERLLNDLNTAQNELVKTAKEVDGLNSSLSKVTGLREYNAEVGKLAESTKKMQDANDRTVASAVKLATAEETVVRATKERITAGADASRILNTMTGGLDANIKLQLRLKTELNGVRDAQKALNAELKTSDRASAGQIARAEELAKREAELKISMQQSNLEIRRTIREQQAAEGSSKQLSARLLSLKEAWDGLNQAERENANVGGVLKNEINALDDEIKELDATTGRHQRNVGNYTSALQGIPGPVGAIIGAFAGASEASDKFINDLQEQRAQQQKNEESNRQLKESIEQLVQANRDLQNSNGENTESIAENNVQISNFRDQLNAAAPAQVGFIAGLKNMAKAGLAFIATPVGATLAALAVGLAAAKGWFEYNKNIAEATKLTKQLTGLSGSELKGFRNEVQATADVFDKDFKEVLIATNAVAKQFKIPFEEALDVINKGFIAGADAGGEFLEQMREYPAQLEAVGLSAQETTAIISQNVKDGIYSDKGIDAIKEAGLRIREMTPATRDAINGIGLSSQELEKGLTEGSLSMFDVIQKVSNKLDELPENSAAVGTAIADIFGGPGEDAGLAYLKTLGAIETDLDKVVDKAGELGTAQAKQLQAAENLNDVFSTLFDSTGGAFESLIANGQLFATEVLLGIITGVIDLTNYFIDLYNESALVRGIFELIGATFKTSYDIILFAGRGILTTFETIGKAAAAIMSGELSSLGSIVAEGLEKGFGDVAKFATDSAGNYVTAFNNTVKGSKIEGISIESGASGGNFEEEQKKRAAYIKKASEAEQKALDAAEEKKNKAAAKAAADRLAALKKLNDSFAELELSRLNVSAEAAKKIVDDEKKTLSEREAALETYLAKKEEMIIVNREKELSAEGLNQSDATRLQEEAQNEILNLKEEGAALSLEILKDQLSKEDAERVTAQSKILAGIETARDTELLALSEKYNNGVLSEEQYANERLKIQREFTRDYVEQEIKALEEILAVNKARGLDVFEQEKQIAALKLRLSEETTEKQIKDLEKLAEKEEELSQLKEELGAAVFDLAVSIGAAGFERQKNRLQEEADLIDQNKQKEIEKVNSSVLTEREKADKIAIIEATAQAKREQIEIRQRQADQAKARFDRAAQAAKIIGETAVKVIEYGGFTPPAILVAAIGAAMLAKVLTTPIPKYADGVESSPEGLAWVGERGKELRIEPDGKTSLTPDHATKTYLKKGTKIIPNHDLKRLAAAQQVDRVLGVETKDRAALDTAAIIAAYDRSAEGIKNTLKGKRENNTILTKGGIKHIHRDGSQWTQYLNRNL